MNDKIKTIVIDDEPLACKRIVNLLEEDKEIHIAAVCKDGNEAIEKINDLQPDVVFLDIQMPEINGFEVLRKIDTDYLPVIVFVTAYDEYAIKAFEVHALDYLLKPFDKARFFDALEQAKKAVHQSSDEFIKEKLNDFLQSFDNSQRPLQHMMIKASDRYFFLKAEDIDWIESAGNYVKIHSGDKNYLIRDTMENMVKKLDSNLFFRIHRSTIVNVNKIRELEQWFHGDYKVIMKDGEKLKMSRNYKDLLQRFT